MSNNEEVAESTVDRHEIENHVGTQSSLGVFTIMNRRFTLLSENQGLGETARQPGCFIKQRVSMEMQRGTQLGR